MKTVDKALCLDVLERGLRNSRYYYQSGQHAGSYVNLDTAVLGDAQGVESLSQRVVIDKLVSQFDIRIRELEREAGSKFSRLAFIDKGGHGPVGAISLLSQLVYRSQKDALLVRPYRNAIRATLRGRRPEFRENILIVSDVATTGRTILGSASKLWDKGAVVCHALVFFDQELGARENLRAHDIALHSLLSRSEVSSSGRNIKLPDVDLPPLHEFGEAF